MQHICCIKFRHYKIVLNFLMLYKRKAFYVINSDVALQNQVHYFLNAAQKKGFFDRIYDDVPPRLKILNTVIPILMHFCKLEHCKPHKAPRHPMKCDIIYDVKLFPIVYRRIYCKIFFSLSNQMLRYKIKCIRIQVCTNFLNAAPNKGITSLY